MNVTDMFATDHVRPSKKVVEAVNAGSGSIDDRSISLDQNTMKEYRMAVGVTLLALGSRFALDPFLGDHLPYVTFFVAVAVATWYGGLGASLTAVVLGGLAANWFFMPPRHSLYLVGVQHQVGYLTYFLVSLAFVGFGQALRRARQNAEVVTEELRHEVHKRKQQEQELRASDERLQLAILAGNAGAWDLDLVTGRNVWSESHFSLLGYEPTANGEATGEMWQHAVLPEDLPGVLIEWERAERGNDLFHSEHRVRRVDTGQILWVRAAGRFLRNDSGKAVRFVGVFFDITERKNAEETLQKSQDRLRSFAQELEQRVTERTHELLQSQDRLRALATELNLAEQRERHRLAAELHDHLQQTLVLGKLKLGQGKRLAQAMPACAELLQQVEEVFSEALRYTRSLVADLNPPVLRDHGLPAGLLWLGDFMKKHDLQVTVQVPEQTDLQLPDDQVVLLFQSVRELLINSSKHAGTGRATLSLAQCDGRLRITVRDEGVGFDLAAASSTGGLSSQFGLFSIRERMRALGGTLTMESAPGQGTSATLSMPIAAHEGVTSVDGNLR